MDGGFSLSDLDNVYMRPWDDCIPSEKLSIDNLPPFFVRLRDDQVGAILDWIEDSTEKTLPKYRLNLYWPHDISTKVWYVPGRENWGKPHKGKFALPGGPTVPAYLDMGLPPSFMSSGKVMRRESETDTENEEHGGAVAKNKRKAGETLMEKVGQNGKRYCTWAATPKTQEQVKQAFGDKIAAEKAARKRETDVLRVELASKEATIAELNGRIEDLEAKRKRHGTELQALRKKDREQSQQLKASEKETEELRDTCAKLTVGGTAEQAKWVKASRERCREFFQKELGHFGDRESGS